tara:strand:- start:1711 stop:2079 length:369 start_codon:yes stop_codon:yes gene_type:complete
MWYRKRVRRNRKGREDQYYSISNKLKKESKITDKFEVMLANLTLEEIVGLRLELAAKSVNHNLFGLHIWYDLHNIIKDAVLKYSYSSSRTIAEASSFLGLNPVNYNKLLKKYKIKEYFNKTE